MFSKGLKSSGNALVQQEAVSAYCKLLLIGVMEDQDLLQQAVLAYFDASLTDNEGAQQALSYTLPVFCYSKGENMRCMAQVAGKVLLAIMDMKEDPEDKEEAVAVNKTAYVLADWTDARKLIITDQIAGFWTEAAAVEANNINGDAHLILAEQLLQRSLQQNCSSKH